MPNKKISELTPRPLASLDGTELVPLVGGGVTHHASIADMKAYFTDGTPSPSAPTPAPTPTSLPWDKLNTRPRLQLPSVVEVAPGATKAYIQMTASGPIQSTCWARARVVNISGGGFNVGFGTDWLAPGFAYYWRPGDDLDQWATINIVSPSSTVGHKFKVEFSVNGWGSDSGPSVEVVVATDAVNELPGTLPFHRKPKLLDLSGATPKGDQDMATIEWSDTGYVGNVAKGTAGAVPCWRSRLAHGYDQGSGNGELGGYLNTDKFPAEAVNPQSKGTDGHGRPYVRLHTQKLAAPVQTYDTTYMPYQASMIQGQRLDAFCTRRGIFRTQVVTPDRKYAWSAFWAIGRAEWGMWPPEIDFFEHFNGIYGAWDKATTTTTQHVGNHGSNARSKVNGMQQSMDDFGYVKGETDLYRQIHDYACLVEDDYITHFLDGVEIMQHVNITDHQTGSTDWEFFPMLNVAVKPPDGTYPYDQGSGDMLIYGIQTYSANSGYVVTDFNEAKPYASRRILPDPTELFPPAITTSPNSNVGEGRAVSLQLAATTGAANATFTWAMEAGGADNALVSITSGGLVTMPAKDFEVPGDANGNNVYEYWVRCTENGNGAFITQKRTITVQDRSEGAAPNQLTAGNQRGLVVAAGSWVLQGTATLGAADVNGWRALVTNGQSNSIKIAWTRDDATVIYPIDGWYYEMEVHNPTGSPILAKFQRSSNGTMSETPEHTIAAGETKTIMALTDLTWERTMQFQGPGLNIRNPAVRPRWT